VLEEEQAKEQLKLQRGRQSLTQALSSSHIRSARSAAVDMGGWGHEAGERDEEGGRAHGDSERGGDEAGESDERKKKGNEDSGGGGEDGKDLQHAPDIVVRMRQLEDALRLAKDENERLKEESHEQHVYEFSLQEALVSASQEIECLETEGEQQCLELADALSSQQHVGGQQTDYINELHCALRGTQDECSALSISLEVKTQALKEEQQLVARMILSVAQSNTLHDEFERSNSALTRQNQQLEDQFMQQQLDFALERDTLNQINFAAAAANTAEEEKRREYTKQALLQMYEETPLLEEPESIKGQMATRKHKQPCREKAARAAIHVKTQLTALPKSASNSALTNLEDRAGCDKTSCASTSSLPERSLMALNRERLERQRSNSPHSRTSTQSSVASRSGAAIEENGGGGASSWVIRMCVVCVYACLFAAVYYGGVRRDSVAERKTVGASFGHGLNAVVASSWFKWASANGAGKISNEIYHKTFTGQMMAKMSKSNILPRRSGHKEVKKKETEDRKTKMERVKSKQEKKIIRTRDELSKTDKQWGIQHQQATETRIEKAGESEQNLMENKRMQKEQTERVEAFEKERQRDVQQDAASTQENEKTIERSHTLVARHTQNSLKDTHENDGKNTCENTDSNTQGVATAHSQSALAAYADGALLDLSQRKCTVDGWMQKWTCHLHLPASGTSEFGAAHFQDEDHVGVPFS